MSTVEALAPPDLSVDGLTVSRGGRTLFSGLTFRLGAGEATALRGPNGAGKTSLLLAISGAIRADAGTIRCRARGEILEREPHIHLLTTQNAVKPRLTIAENLGFWRALNGPGTTEVSPALERVGLGGLDAIEAGHLSTGQQRRLALARLLVSHRTIWLLDEPTASLDTAGETLVAKLIGDHCGTGGIVIVATHHDLALPYGGIGPRFIDVRGGTATVDAGPRP